ncbi:hypothetical protein ACR9E3_17145 [Actinomycetospora sp. C-140]
MGTHSARRSGGAMTTVASRGLFTATAAFALVGGSAGMAFAGEAPSHGHESSSDSEHGSEHKSSESCEIPIVDKSGETVDHVANAATGNATASTLETVNAASKPVHDAACPPAKEILGAVDSSVPGASQASSTVQSTVDTLAGSVPGGSDGGDSE